MTSISETGHAINVANFESLIISAIAFGTSYNPSKDSIKLPALQALLSASKESLNTVNVALAYSNSVSEREAAFEPFSKLITRVNNAPKASATSVKVDESIQTIVRKLHGRRRASAKITDVENKASETNGKELNQIFGCTIKLRQQVAKLRKLITLLESVTFYATNEEDLKIVSLKAMQRLLKNASIDVIKASFQLSNARIARNRILYKPITGLADLALDIKTYIKSVFGTTSPQYKQIARLNFINKKTNLQQQTAVSNLTIAACIV